MYHSRNRNCDKCQRQSHVERVKKTEKNGRDPLSECEWYLQNHAISLISHHNAIKRQLRTVENASSAVNHAERSGYRILPPRFYHPLLVAILTYGSIMARNYSKRLDSQLLLPFAFHSIATLKSKMSESDMVWSQMKIMFGGYFNSKFSNGARHANGHPHFPILAKDLTLCKLN